MEENSKIEPPTIDIVDLLKMHGWGVVEGADEVRKKIQELAE